MPSSVRTVTQFIHLVGVHLNMGRTDYMYFKWIWFRRFLVAIILVVFVAYINSWRSSIRDNKKKQQEFRSWFSSTRNVWNMRNESSERLIVVSAFFNLGTFQKGEGWKYFDSGVYKNWLHSFQYMNNPLVFYTDCSEFKEHVKSLRSNLTSLTKIVFIEDRTKLWAFQQREATQDIYRQNDYPKHHPNTVIADYSCAQHAKYELMENTIKEKVFDSEFYAWLDIGYFREMVMANTDLHFVLTKPPGLNISRVAFNLIFHRDMSAEPREIFRNNHYWVGGGFFVSKQDTMLKFIHEYKRAVSVFLDQKLMNSDQQVIYSMYTKIGRQGTKPSTELQLYVPNGHGDPWFYLGYLCLKKFIKS